MEKGTSGGCFDKHCDGCKYYSKITGAIYYCTYLMQTDRRRPCPPGKGCTVKIPKKRRKARESTECD